LQTAILLLRIDDIVSGSKKNKEESGGEAQPMEYWCSQWRTNHLHTVLPPWVSCSTMYCRCAHYLSSLSSMLLHCVRLS